MAAAWAQCSTCETGETGETAESQRFEARTSMHRCFQMYRIIQNYSDKNMFPDVQNYSNLLRKEFIRHALATRLATTCAAEKLLLID